MVQRHTRTSPHKWESEQDPTVRFRPLWTMREAGHPRSPSRRVRLWEGNMGLNAETVSVDPSGRPMSHTHWTASVPPISGMAATKARAVLWVLRNLILYKMQIRRSIPLQDYMTSCAEGGASHFRRQAGPNVWGITWTSSRQHPTTHRRGIDTTQGGTLVEPTVPARQRLQISRVTRGQEYCSIAFCTTHS